ncbi:MAG: hydantoinase/oxoprolinase family protein, partial [Gammaproteobacteria bacterium]|nr:hydantoinase/oxoprolinase family protein [Gammaproteobacteria bacterium]
FDMGGTTAKASVIVDGHFSMAPEAEVGGGAALGHRMVRGGGHVVQAPTIDIAEVGAGGGSIAWLDAGGGFQVGPGSAGAAPGPACYGLGGESATVTDANVLLGYLNPTRLVGGELALDIEAARHAVTELARGLGQSPIDTAYGIHLIANARMMRALSAVSSERGLEPARFPILGFGGNGGVHVAGLAESLGIERVIIPPSAGIFSALGLLFADAEHQSVRGHYKRLDGIDLDALNQAFAQLRDETCELLTADGYAPTAQALRYELEIKYVGQNGALSVAVQTLPIQSGALPTLAEAFAHAHQTTFGYRSDQEPLQLVALRVIGRGIADSPRLPARIIARTGRSEDGMRRKAYFGPEHGWLDTPVVGRHALGAAMVSGPLVIEEYDSTTVVRPGWQARLDDWNNIVMDKT